MDSIAVIDFGSQYAHLIANRIRRLGIYAEILLPKTPLKKLSFYKGIILSGGPQSVYDSNAPTIHRGIFSMGIPILGICYGHQLITHLLGGKVVPGSTKEYGLAELSIRHKTGIFHGVSSKTQVWMSHGDTILKLPPHFRPLAQTADCHFAAAFHPAKKIFSTQFHIEVTHTTKGMKMLKNFLRLCHVKREWKINKFLNDKMREIKKMLGIRKVFLLVSGGVDSTVAYALLSKALGTHMVYGLFIDTGFLRKDEGEKTKHILKKIGVKNFHMVNAQKIFFTSLSRIFHPEEKRKIIGDIFLRVQAEAIKKLKLNPDHWVLGQGTIYPDTIESAGTRYADKIKTHHNRVPQILALIKKGKVIEPLAELYKDEVRKLGEKLGLPRAIIRKHPFPGPGLAVRIVCAKTEKFPENLPGTERAISAFLKPYKLFGKILPIQSVGVQGDNRTYRNPLLLWGVHPQFSKLEQLSTMLTNRFSAINRVCFLLHPYKLNSLRLLVRDLIATRVKILQELDDLVMKFLKKHGLEDDVWQCPTVLLPLSVNGIPREAVVLRPVCSEEAMTANFYKMAPILLAKLVKKLVPKVSAVLYDITNKPPGTIEWE